VFRRPRREHLLAERALSRRTPRAPCEYLRRVMREQGMPEESLTTLTALFEKARFSPHPIPDSAPRRERAPPGVPSWPRRHTTRRADSRPTTRRRALGTRTASSVVHRSRPWSPMTRPLTPGCERLRSRPRDACCGRGSTLLAKGVETTAPPGRSERLRQPDPCAWRSSLAQLSGADIRTLATPQEEASSQIIAGLRR
jgi:hypothetical protein